MKRVKRLLCASIVLLSVLFITACGKDYSSITYKRFVEKMGNELSYVIKDNTALYQTVYERYYTATKDDVMVSFFEFKDEKEAKDYVKKNYDGRKYFSYKEYDGYSTVKSTKSSYLSLIQIDNIVISGYSEKTSNKNLVNKALKELGY